MPASPLHNPAISGGPVPPRALLGVGQVQHTRLRPARHGFSYATYFLMLPMRALRQSENRNDGRVDALAPAHKAWGGVAHNRAGLISFHDRDHGDGRADALKWLESVLQAEGVNDADGEVWLHTYPRVLGYVFKPVSFWYCHRADGSLAAVLAEVNNTFGERHCYLLSGPNLRWGQEMRASKVFHVSPFCAIEGDYRFRFMRTTPAGAASERTVVRIEHHDGQGPLLLTSVSGTLTEATPRQLRKAFFGMPMMSLGVILRIHWQALQLAVKRVPFFRKPEPPQGFVTR